MPSDAKPKELQELAPNSTFGPYRITRLLGKGGMGAVYEAEHEGDGRVVALKLLTVDLEKMDARERFLREGQMAAAINHPNAVYIYGTEEIDGTPAITMELVPGGSLDEKIKERGALPWPEAVEDILQVIDGLDAAYSAGVLHRDVKPSNCFVGPAGTVKIGDFGLSKPVDAGDQQRLTQTGLFLGTPVFSSPEQLLGETLDVRSDIYAVGVTFYSLLTGELPYHSGSMMQVVAAVLNGVPAPITNYRTDLPQPVIDVVMKSIARKASDRYQNYQEFRAAVAALRVAETAPARLWDRFRASIVDWLVNVALLAVISATFLPTMFGTNTNGTRRADWRQVALSIAITLLVVGIPEALRGASIGKWLIGIRVIGPNGLAPGFLREAGRIALLASTDLATLAVQNSVIEPNRKAGATFLASALMRGLFLLTARRSNGWRLLHDFITGTRVVRTRASSVQRRGEAHRAVAPALTGNERRIGPYVVLGPVREGSNVLSGWDSAMRRAVWIVPRPENAPAAAPERRSLSRLTRLRWVGGRRAGADSWDAFEAPIGEPLSARLTRPVPWDAQQAWLLDISNELIAAQEDGTALSGMSADSLWITPTDRIVFLETDEGTPIASATGNSGNASTNQQSPSLITAQLFDRIDAARVPGTPLPRYAARTIAAARVAANPAVLRTLVQETLGRPVTVTRARRAGMTMATVAPVIVFSFIGWFSTRQTMRIDKQGFLMSSLVTFVADSASTNIDSVRMRAKANNDNPRASKRIARAMEMLGISPTVTPDTITPPDTLRHQRHLAEVYLSTTLAARARDTIAKTTYMADSKEKQMRVVILQRNPAIDSTDARAARHLVDSTWKGVVPGVGLSTLTKYIPFVLVATIIVIGAGFAAVLGLLVRRGPMLRGFQLDLTTSSGAPAGRLRLLWRNVVIWSAVLLPFPLVWVAPYLSIRALAATMAIGAALYLVLWGVALWCSLKTPSRGIAERISGTWLVNE